MASELLYAVGVSEIEATAPVPFDPPCVVCGGSSARPRFQLESLPWRIVHCDSCGTGRLDPLPAAGEIAAFYPPAYYGDTGKKFRGYVEWAVRFVAARHVRFLARRVPAGGRVLDVGCGRGTLLSALADRGLEVHGTEVSRAAVEGADPRAEIRIAAGLVEADYPGGHFDLVILWHVFEHLRDPRETLVEVRRILKAGGEVVVAVPNASSWQARWSRAGWFHLDPPRHVFHFPVEALSRLLESTGFACRSEHHFSLRQNPYGWVQSALNRRPNWPRNSLYELLQRRPGGATSSLDRGTKAFLLSAFVLGMPVGLALEVVATAFRTGATVHVVATAVG